MLDRLEKLKKRKLFQWAIGYLAAGWLFLEIFAFIADRFGWPGALTRGALILFIVGFFVVLVLAWFHGEKGRQQVSGVEKAWISALLVVGVVLVWVFAPEPDPGVASGSSRGDHNRDGATRFLMMLPEEETIKGMEGALAISPDGSRLAYTAGRGDDAQLYVKELNAFEATPIPDTEGARAPFFSPDGEWLGFFADEAVKKVPLAGGSPQVLVEGVWSTAIEYVLSGSWTTDDVLYLTYPGSGSNDPGAGMGSGIWSLPAQGGNPMQVTQGGWEESHFMPQLLPGGDHLLFSSWAPTGEIQVMAVSLETGEKTIILESGSAARYLDTGHLAYQLNSDLYVVPFDPVSLEITGPHEPAIEKVLTGEYGTVQYAVSENGNLAYVPAGVESIERTMVWMDMLGHMEIVAESPIDSYSPRLSPEGDQVIFQRRPEGKLWLMDLDRGAMGRVVDETSIEIWHIWSDDGNSVVFNSNLDGGDWFNLWIKGVGESAEPRRLTNNAAHHHPQDWSPDGEVLVYTEGPMTETGVDIWTLRIPRDWDGDTAIEPEPFLVTGASEFQPTLSPNGRWMAYVSNSSGSWQVYLAPYPGPGAHISVSTNGGSEPMWSPDGGTLYYRSPGDRQISRQMYAVSVSGGASGDPADLDLGLPELLFDGPFFQCSEFGRSYDMSPDGDRFLMVKDQRPELTATQINVVVNWFSELPVN